MKRVVVGLAMLLMASVAVAQEQKTAMLIYTRDVADTSYSYCVLAGEQGDPFGSPIPGVGLIATSGSSATVTAVVAGDLPFTSVAVGDMLIITEGRNTYKRTVVTRSSATSVILDSALTLTGAAWSWYDSTCGGTAADGWLRMTGEGPVTFLVDVTAFHATTIGYSVECRVMDSTGTALAAATIASATTANYSIAAGSACWDWCRLGVKINTDTGTNVMSVYVAKR